MNAARTVGSVLLYAGVAAVVAAAMARWAVDTDPRIGTVRLDDLATEFVAAAVRAETSGGEAAEASHVWALALEAALDRVVDRHGIVLVASEAVLGARWITPRKSGRGRSTTPRPVPAARSGPSRNG